ncbi:hypothetical protein [Thiococcus pfennigii]|jgi:hypothetical protein|nr:hypothetical protein [Thiococcus pfennigii]
MSSMDIGLEPFGIGMAPASGLDCLSSYWRGYWFFGFHFESHGPA